MQRYQSHKIVEAFKVMEAEVQGEWMIVWNGDRSETLSIETKRCPLPSETLGGYAIRYPDGFTSWSPAKAFEEGYVGISAD